MEILKLEWSNECIYFQLTLRNNNGQKKKLKKSGDVFTNSIQQNRFYFFDII